MIYRHSKKAGNEGDVIKHISLIAALDTIMKSWNKDKGNKDKVFSYCDTYAANGLNLLKSGLGWTKGIDRIQSQMNHTDLTINHHVVNWKNSWWIPPEETEGKYNAGFYPGSSLFVANLFENNKIKNYKVRLWDTDIDCIEDQFKTFCKYDKTTECLKLDPKISLYSESAFGEISPNPDFKNHLEQADFLFVDPPNLKIPQNYKNLADIRADNGNWTMFWFPLKGYRTKGANPQIVEFDDSKNIRVSNWGNNSAKIFIQYTKACSNDEKFQKMIGCQIVLVGPPDTEECKVRSNVKNAIDFVISLFNPLSEPPNNFDTFNAQNWGLPYGWDSLDHGVGGWPDTNI